MVFLTENQERVSSAIPADEHYRTEYYATASETAGRGATANRSKQRINYSLLVGDVDHYVYELSMFIYQIHFIIAVTWAVPLGLRLNAVGKLISKFCGRSNYTTQYNTKQLKGYIC